MRYKESAAEYIKGVAREASFIVALGIGSTALILASARDEWKKKLNEEQQAYEAKAAFEQGILEGNHDDGDDPRKGWKAIDDAAQQATRDREDAEMAMEEEEDL